MPDSSSHSAAGQALGYFQQCMRALAELGRRGATEPSVEMRIEMLDDIDFSDSGSPTELLQVKHHIGPGTVTMKSIDLWRSLNVWMDLDIDENPALRMVTTQNTDANLALLRNGAGRDVSQAVDLLVEAAAGKGNATSRAWRRRFLGLDEDQRIALIERVVIDDATPSAGGLDSELVQVFRYAITPGKEKAFIALLKGWWAGIAVRLLDGSLDAITGSDLAIQVADIVDQLRADSLPVDPDVRQRFDESITAGYQDRIFVHQLAWIALDHERLWKAIRDYHRAYTQRSFWLRYQLIGEEELDRFAFKLYDEWEQVFDDEVARMATDDREAGKVGQDVLSRVARECRSRLRDRFDEAWFNRGMFHALADGELGQQVGWHPDFQVQLEGLLSDVTT
ncbi:ABC-three component system protein [Aeromicrobium sp. HA]|uniref:ABC-three component system protein n=1 Tax=Aeromicrobium sp. HA TaxID=3009077 RepID=UPI0022B07AEF|nr:ABC-three component system protein [Aeromicrobium sp. HA]